MGGINIYSTRKNWKIILFVFATIICIVSLSYTNKLVSDLDSEERKKIELWAEATNQLVNSGMGPNNNILASRIMQENTTIPIILTNEVGEIIGNRNLPQRPKQEAFLKKQLDIMMEQHEPIIIEAKMNEQVILTQYLYYKDSYILSQLRFYPLLQLVVIFLYIGIAYLAFNRSRKSEQNLVWAGMAKETAHQIGTPLSSLMAWIELLKEKSENEKMVSQMGQDVKRLETIADRFSKIGSKPELENIDVVKIIEKSIEYLKLRMPSNINFDLIFPDKKIKVPVNKILFEWVIENLVKNAVDAMKGKGEIIISIINNEKNILISIADNGPGIDKTISNNIFKPGVTSKKRGWGLGLSLSKRIIEDYHKGSIFVVDSKKDEGTTFAINLLKN